jgi:hypothetical protein
VRFTGHIPKINQLLNIVYEKETFNPSGARKVHIHPNTYKQIENPGFS